MKRLGTLFIDCMVIVAGVAIVIAAESTVQNVKQYAERHFAGPQPPIESQMVDLPSVSIELEPLR